MNIRLLLLLAVPLALTDGASALAQPDAQTPGTVAPPASAVAPIPSAPPAAAASSSPADNKKPAAAATPAKPQTPVADTAPSNNVKPATATPPASQQTPVVTTAPAPGQQPATAEPAKAQAAPTVTTTPAQAEKPAATPAQTPTPVVTAPAPKPVIVTTPLPKIRPVISKATIEKSEPAKYLFAAKKLPSAGHPRAIGYYPKGCLAGGVELPVNGRNWQVMRLSRNRNWGHPELVRFLERFAPAAATATGWHGILIGDMAQPRGGPLPFGHKSHQVGLDVDIWFRPMPGHRLSRKQRESMSATSLVAPDWKHLNPKTWTPADAAFIKTAAEQPDVERIFVNAVIKKELCALEGKKHASWMAKVRPWYGHNDHMHVRLKCPADSPHCRHQPAVPSGDGCGEKQLAFWFSDRVLHPKPPKHPKPAKQIMLADMPAACKVVLNAPGKKSHLAAETP